MKSTTYSLVVWGAFFSSNSNTHNETNKYDNKLHFYFFFGFWCSVCKTEFASDALYTQWQPEVAILISLNKCIYSSASLCQVINKISNVYYE